jgi:hypothetical protein
MQRMPWTVYLWPGLPQIVGRGNWSALALAIGAAALLNVTLLGSWVWTELIAPELRILCWALLGAVWGVSALMSAWLDRRQAAMENPDPAQDLFGEALDHYLRGNWFEAERTLGKVLRRNGRDLEARLMRATLLRHTKRWEEAARELNLLVRLEGARKWELEMRRERELLAEARAGENGQKEDVPEDAPGQPDSSGAATAGEAARAA